MAVQYESYKFPRMLTTMSANFYEKPITAHGTGDTAIARAWATGLPPATGWKMHHRMMFRATDSSGNAHSIRERFFPDPVLHLNFELIISFLCCYPIPTGPIARGKPRKTSTRNTLPPDRLIGPGRAPVDIISPGHNSGDPGAQNFIWNHYPRRYTFK